VSETGGSRGALSRRQVLRGGLGAAAAIGLGGSLTGCGSALSAGLVGTTLAPGTVTYWNLFGGGDGARMQSMQQQYQSEHGPDSLQAATFAWGNPYYTKVSLATLGDAPPDVAAAEEVPVGHRPRREVRADEAGREGAPAARQAPAEADRGGRSEPPTQDLSAGQGAP